MDNQPRAGCGDDGIDGSELDDAGDLETAVDEPAMDGGDGETTAQVRDRCPVSEGDLWGWCVPGLMSRVYPPVLPACLVAAA